MENKYPTLDLVFKDPSFSDKIWSFLNLQDALNVSVCSRYGASMVVSAEAVNYFLASLDKVNRIGNFNIAFGNEISCGMLRRVMNRLYRGTEAVLFVDPNSGRVLLDIGSAFNEPQAIVDSQAVSVVSDDPHAEEGHQIFKYLEGNSYDEFDDFNPRHPKPKSKNHRRGDSYFNSDTDMLSGSDLLGSKTMRDALPRMKAGYPPQEEEENPEPQDAFALKNKFLAKTRYECSDYNIRVVSKRINYFIFKYLSPDRRRLCNKPRN